MTTAELIRRGAQRYGGRTAIVCGDTALSFAEVDERATRLAHALLARRVDRVGLLVGNGPDSIPLDFACAKAGIARVPLNARLAAPEQNEILRIAAGRRHAARSVADPRERHVRAAVLAAGGGLGGAGELPAGPVHRGDRAVRHDGDERRADHARSAPARRRRRTAGVLRPEDHAGERLRSCGHPAVEAEVKLDEATDEILVRAPFTAAGYHGDAQLDRETFLADGWVRTRDVGRFDDEGYLYLVDRTSDMIASGGYNVYPREVEDALAAHPAVREAVVVGAPDERWVEAVTALVVVSSGVSEAELIEHCRTRLGSYKAPKSVRFVDEIPKSPVGKLLRRAVRDPLWEGHERPL